MVLQAGIFDLDGVITDTATVHFKAWKRTFDVLLPPEHLFSEDDYLHHVDGKPRLDGIASFFQSRSMTVPQGTGLDDAPEQTMHGLAKRKQQLFLEMLARDGVPVFESTVRFIRHLRAQGLKTAVVSSSKNCKMVLEQAGLQDLFETRVDGVSLDELGLAGKPEPDMFLEAARHIEVMPEHALVVEDALSGVAAGKAGGFGLVIGLDRRGMMGELFYQQGADVVLPDMHGMSVAEAEERMRHDA
jgi:beta-phosphoglucomutase family hydrolase